MLRSDKALALASDVSMPNMGGVKGLFVHYKHVAAVHIAGVIGGLALVSVMVVDVVTVFPVAVSM